MIFIQTWKWILCYFHQFRVEYFWLQIEVELLYCYKKYIRLQLKYMVKYIQNYALYEIIGSGVYGKVYRAINNADKKQYAVKVIPIARFRQNKKLEQCTVNEINILSSIESNQHIIRYYDMLKTNNNFYFIYQFCNGGTLENLLAKQKKLSEPKALLIFKQLLDAFQILNKYNIMHRDMKPDNIFFHNGIIKLGDFGFCKNLGSAQDMAKTMLGSPIYMAPQVLKGEIYSIKADIWSLGVVLYEMVFGQCPFQSNSIANLIEVLNTQNLNFPGSISPVLKNIISRMLTKDPFQRIGWMQLFQIKINSQGYIEETKQAPKISSLNDAKISEQNSTSQQSNSAKLLPNGNNSLTNGKTVNPNVSEDLDGRSFKKNRNTTTAVMNVKEDINPQTLKMVSEEHKSLIEGVKLAMDIVDSKVSNNMGYAYLVLNRVSQQVGELSAKCDKKDLISIFQKQLKDIKQEKQNISSKMFAYELKGLDDWKKYLRGKFFEQQKTISLWYRMVSYLNGSKIQQNESYKVMTESVKSILY